MILNLQFFVIMEHPCKQVLQILNIVFITSHHSTFQKVTHTCTEEKWALIFQRTKNLKDRNLSTYAR